MKNEINELHPFTAIKEGNTLSIENAEHLYLPIEYFDFSELQDDVYDIKITHNNQTVLSIFIDKANIPIRDKTILTYLEKDEKGKLMPVNITSGERTRILKFTNDWNIDNANFDDVFLITYERSGTNFKEISISQQGHLLTTYDQNEIKYKNEFCWIDNNNNLVSRFGQITLPKKSFGKNQLTENDNLRGNLFSINLNYKGNIPNENNEAWKQIKLLSTRIPNDTRAIAEKVDDKVKNFSLLYNKNAKTEETNGFRGSLINYNNWKNFGLKSADFKAIADKEKQNAVQLLGENNVKCLPNVYFNWRLAIGLGNESVYETSITLHHIYGIPYIPASAIKGITHHYCRDLLEENGQDVTEDLIDDIFGKPDTKGKIIFFDAFPIEIPTIMTDVMTPHYGDYYKGIAPPADWQSPNPILFLTVENTTFQFIIGCKEANSELIEVASKWLKDALQNKGIGAKTAVGYGYMKDNISQ